MARENALELLREEDIGMIKLDGRKTIRRDARFMVQNTQKRKNVKKTGQSGKQTEKSPVDARFALV